MTDPQANSLDKIHLFKFHGGVHPPENKGAAATQKSVDAGIPKTLHLPLPAISTQLELQVTDGDKVLKGQLLATDKSGRQPPFHAPTSGIVIGIEKIPSSHPSGIAIAMLIIETDGKQQWIERTPSSLEQILSSEPNELIQKIFSAGIVGMGGAGFPTSTKLATSQSVETPAKTVSTLILNGAECEPYISCDDRLMQEQAEKVLQGANIIRHCIHAEKVQIVIEDNKPLAIKALRNARDQLQLDIGIIKIPTGYPSGGEKQLIEIVTGKQVATGKFPAHLGITVQNVATAVAVVDALVDDSPLLERLVTVTGKSLQHRANYRVLLGTPVEYLLKKAGFNPAENAQLIIGGPMMGHNLSSTQTPIIKTTNCIIAPSASELPTAPAALACIRCGLCTEACPAQLLPQQLYWHSRAEEWEKTERLNLFDCIECGACSYVCPSNIPLVEYYRFAKNAVRNKNADKIQIEAARVRHDKRQLRLQRLQHEKATRRKQKAEEAKRRKEQRLQQDGLTDEVKKQSVADAVARVKARKLKKATMEADVAIAEKISPATDNSDPAAEQES